MAIDLSRQEQAVSQLKEEFDRLNSQFDAILKAQGVTVADLRAESLDNLPPELKAKLDEARAAAKRAGEERKGHAQTEWGAASGARPAPRAGAIRL
ncbi:hypothetical protein FACS1894116_09220 [Betaproteobacteria bacterium]|nr:hypothetical protein FACS1894116_09220 [Betaproteobacteria bacterium]GHU24498.1 hypothetical protein FACS189488_09280 [Betaproteobacteria bacterium]GHU30084.1 hypothetical protein FACS189497_09250 [Betaproteobacteria bacterium]